MNECLCLDLRGRLLLFTLIYIYIYISEYYVFALTCFALHEEIPGKLHLWLLFVKKKERNKDDHIYIKKKEKKKDDLTFLCEVVTWVWWHMEVVSGYSIFGALVIVISWILIFFFNINLCQWLPIVCDRSAGEWVLQVMFLEFLGNCKGVLCDLIEMVFYLLEKFRSGAYGWRARGGAWSAVGL